MAGLFTSFALVMGVGALLLGVFTDISAESVAVSAMGVVLAFLGMLFLVDKPQARSSRRKKTGLAAIRRWPGWSSPVLRWSALSMVLVLVSALGWGLWQSPTETPTPPQASNGTVIQPLAAPEVSPAPAPRPDATTTAAPVVAPTPEAAQDTVEQAVETWRDAWAARDVDAYLAAYAPSFRPADGSTLPQWQNQRRDRLTKAKDVSIVLEQMETQMQNGRAMVRFVQKYRSTTVNDAVRKSLTLTHEADRWLITEETVEEALKKGS